MENIKYANRSSQIFNEIKNVQCHTLADIYSAATSLGFFNLDFVQIEKNTFDFWCNSTLQDKMQWRLIATIIEKFNEYTIVLSSDPSVYGHGVTQARVAEINEILAGMIKREFDAINIEFSHLDGCGKITGPDQEIIDEINNWVAENWQAAL